MQSKRRFYGRNCDMMYPSPENPLETTKTPKNDRTLPYKLLRFPASKSALWNHNSTGKEETLQFINGVPKLAITKDILRLGHRLVISDDGDEVNGTLNGVVTFDKQLNQLVICIGGKIITSVSEETASNTKLQFSRELRSKTPSRNDMEIFTETKRILQNSTRTKETISIGRFVYVKVCCVYERNVRSTVKFDLWTDVATCGAIFDVYPIEPLSVIPTALSKGLSDPNGNTFLHGEPKTGYLTMDELRRLLLVLDTDPKVSSLPLVGVWISGIESIQNPFVWASCLRYVNCNALKERVCRPPDPFLIAFYNRPTFTPQFYDCIHRTMEDSADFVFHSGNISSTIDLNNVSKDEVEVFLRKTQNEPLKLEISNVVETPCQKLLFSPQLTIERPGPSSLRMLQIQTGISPSFDLQQRLTRESPAENSKCPSQSNVAFNSQATNSIGFRSNDNDGGSLPIPPEIYQLLEAQEQQLKLLKQQVDELVRERSESACSSPRSVVSNASECPQSMKSTKVLSSTATMTSFVWPPVQTLPVPPPPSSCCSKCTKSDSPRRDAPTVQSRTHSDALESSDYDNERSVELVRQQQVDSRLSLSKIEDSLGNLQLATFSELPDSPRSTFFVDLHEFQESFASSESSPSLPRPVSIESGNSVQFTDSEHNSTNFYDNLLRRIHTVLSQQSPENGRDDRTNHYRSPNINKSVFDSLFLPRLNYISLQLSSIDTDQSAEFNALARKYLSTKNTQSPSGPSDTERSLATTEYLRKYRL